MRVVRGSDSHLRNAQATQLAQHLADGRQFGRRIALGM